MRMRIAKCLIKKGSKADGLALKPGIQNLNNKRGTVIGFAFQDDRGNRTVGKKDAKNQGNGFKRAIIYIHEEREIK